MKSLTQLVCRVTVSGLILAVTAVARLRIESFKWGQYIRPWAHAMYAECHASGGTGNIDYTRADWMLPSMDPTKAAKVYKMSRTNYTTMHGKSGFDLTTFIYLQLRGLRGPPILTNVTCRITTLDPVTLTSSVVEETRAMYLTRAMLGIYVGTGGANAYVGTSVNVTCSVGVIRSAFDHRDPLSKQFVFADFTYFKLSRLVDGKPPEVLAHLERPRPPHEIETPHHFQRWWGDYCNNFRKSGIKQQTCEVQDSVWWVFSIRYPVPHVTKEMDGHTYVCDAQTKDIIPSRAVFSLSVLVPPVVNLAVLEWYDADHVYAKRVECRANDASPAVSGFRWQLNRIDRTDLQTEKAIISCGFFHCNTTAQLTLPAEFQASRVLISCDAVQSRTDVHFNVTMWSGGEGADGRM